MVLLFCFYFVLFSPGRNVGGSCITWCALLHWFFLLILSGPGIDCSVALGWHLLQIVGTAPLKNSTFGFPQASEVWRVSNNTDSINLPWKLVSLCHGIPHSCLIDVHLGIKSESIYITERPHCALCCHRVAGEEWGVVGRPGLGIRRPAAL